MNEYKRSTELYQELKSIAMKYHVSVLVCQQLHPGCSYTLDGPPTTVLFY